MEVRGIGDRGSLIPGRRHLSRREFLKLGGAGLAGAAMLGAAGCGGSTVNQTKGVTNLVFSFGPDSSGSLQSVIDKFNKQYKGQIQVTYREMPSDTDGYFNQLRTELQAGASPIDIIGGDVTWPAQLAENGWILDLSDRFKPQMRQKYVDAAIQSVSYKNGIWGVPFFTDAGLMYYRKDLLDKSGISKPPQTWGEFKGVAKQVRDESGTKYGFIFQGAEYQGGIVDAMEYVWSHGGNALEKKSQAVIINKPDPVDGLQTERSMITDGVAPQIVTIYKEPETAAAFLNGETVFARNWPYMYGLISDPTQSSIKPEQVGISAIPQADGFKSYSGLGGWNMYLNAASKDKADAAWEFMTFASGPKIARSRAIDGGFLPPLQSLYEDQSILDKVPVARFAKEALQSARPRPVSPYYSDLSIVMSQKFSQSLQGDMKPKQAAQSLATEMRNVIDLGKRLVA